MTIYRVSDEPEPEFTPLERSLGRLSSYLTLYRLFGQDMSLYYRVWSHLLDFFQEVLGGRVAASAEVVSCTGFHLVLEAVANESMKKDVPELDEDFRYLLNMSADTIMLAELVSFMWRPGFRSAFRIDTLKI